eukprot:m.184080 g.184080  ORF g.184080 m.184080 type:complete len:889 (+) comp16662_c0_seq2:66-2732(+)
MAWFSLFNGVLAVAVASISLVAPTVAYDIPSASSSSSSIATPTEASHWHLDVLASHLSSSHFDQWLHDLILSLPDIKDIHVLGWTLNFIHGQCSDFLLDEVAKTPSTHADFVSVQMKNIAINCTYTWTAVSPTQATYTGPTYLDIANSDVAFAVNLTTCEDGTPCLRTHDVSSSFKVNELELKNAPPELAVIFDIAKPAIRDAIEAGLDVAVDGAVDVLIDIAATSVLKAMQSLADKYAVNATAAPPLPLAPDAVDVRDDEFVDMLHYMTSVVLGNSTYFNLNTLVGVFTNGTNAIKLDRFPANFSIVLSGNNTGNVSARLEAVYLEDLNSFSTINMLQPVSASRITSRLAFAGLTVGAIIQYNVSLTGALASQTPLVETGSVRASFGTLSGVVDLDFDVSKVFLHQLYPESFYNPGCLASTIRNADVSLIETSFDFDNISLVISDDLHLNALVADLFALALQPVLPQLPQIFSYALNEPVRELLNDGIQDWLFKSTECVNTPAESWMATWMAGGGAVLSLIIVILLLHMQRGPKVYDESSPMAFGPLSRAASDAKRKRVPLLSGINCEPLDDLYETNAQCFGNEEKISVGMRYGMPIMLIFTIVLLIMSQSRVAGSAYFNLHYNDTDVELPVIKTLMFTRTVRDMWDARVYTLVCFIVAFSGIWPHVKLLMMLYAWVAPVTWLPVRQRELFLQVLDFLGKWSILDIYVSIMLLVGLHLHVPLANGLDGPAYVDLWVETNPAVFYYWTTIMLSLMLTHVMLHVHRSVVYANAQLTPLTSERDVLCSHHFFTRGRFYTLTIGGRLLLGLAIAATLAAIIFGIQATAFTFQFEGLAAWLIEYTGGSSERSLSVLEMAINLPQSAQDPNSGSLFRLFSHCLPLHYHSFFKC